MSSKNSTNDSLKSTSTNIEVNIQSNEAFYIVQGLINIYLYSIIIYV